MIPKKIHYCWFGGAEKPAIVQKCMASWKKYMPEYEIIEWNESNYNVHKILFIDEAYQAKKWAFVSDYARFDILNQHGGIYFDTDVELLKTIPNDILGDQAFTGMESIGTVAPGLVFASVPNTDFLHEILTVYQDTHFLIDGKPNFKTVNWFTTEILARHGYVSENRFQKVYGLSIYPSEYFCSFDLDVHEYDIRPESISVHHYAGTWNNSSGKVWVQGFIKKVFGIKFYRNLLKIKRKIMGVSVR